MLAWDQHEMPWVNVFQGEEGNVFVVAKYDARWNPAGDDLAKNTGDGVGHGLLPNERYSTNCPSAAKLGDQIDWMANEIDAQLCSPLGEVGISLLSQKCYLLGSY
jgi:hypothetical protein